MWADRAQPKKKKKCVWMNKNNVNLLVYSLTPESGIKIPA
jgi:phage regulator Rha-like protein